LHREFSKQYTLLALLFCGNNQSLELTPSPNARAFFHRFLIQGFHVQNRSSTFVDAAYLLFQREIRRIQPSTRRFALPHHHISRVVRKIAGRRACQAVSTACILINVLLMLGDNSDKPGWLSSLLFVQSCVFLVVLALEVVMNYIGYGFGALFDDHWKLFDVIILVGAGVGFFVDRKFTAAFQVLFIYIYIYIYTYSSWGVFDYLLRSGRSYSSHCTFNPKYQGMQPFFYCLLADFFQLYQRFAENLYFYLNWA
jgi:hypothetical protein